MPSRSGSSNPNLRFFASTLGASVAYATLRYNVFAGVPWAEFPVYVLNKGVALGGASLIAISYLANRFMPAGAEGRASRSQLARQAGLTGFGLSVAHVLASFTVLNPAHYPLQFTRGELNGVGWACLGSGALAVALFSIPAAYSIQTLMPTLGPKNWKRAQRVGYVGLALTAAHVLAIGARNWPAMSTWPGAMPPISLLSFLACLTPIVVKLGAGSLTEFGRATSSDPAADAGTVPDGVPS